MSAGKVDQWIEMLGGDSSECKTALCELEKLGVPALHRLFQAIEGVAHVPVGRWPKDGCMNRSMALGRLGQLYPEVLLGLVQGKQHLKVGTIQGLGFTGDKQLKTIAREALKIFGDDW